MNKTNTSRERLTFTGAIQQNKVYSPSYTVEKYSSKVIGTVQPRKKQQARIQMDDRRQSDLSGFVADQLQETPQVKKQRQFTLINKYQLSLASFIKDHKTEVKFSGTKRFCDKSGDYYLKNVLIEHDSNNCSVAGQKQSLDESSTISNAINKHNGIHQFTAKASAIKARMPMNTLTPIPIIKKQGSLSRHEDRKLTKAERTAVHIRRMEYSTMKKQKTRPLPKRLSSIIFIQRWWRTIFSIIRIQKFFRGWIFRKKLISSLNNEEALIENLLVVEGICTKVLMKRCFKAIANKKDKRQLPIKVKVKRNSRDLSVIKGEIELIRRLLRKWLFNARNYFITHSTVLDLLKLSKRRYNKGLKISRAIRLLLVKTLKPTFNTITTFKRDQRKKKERQLRTFENKLALQPANSNPNSLQTTIRSPDLNLSKANQMKDASFVNLDKAEMRQLNSIKRQLTLQAYFNLWRDLAMKRCFCRRMRRKKRLNEAKDKLRELFGKWRRLVRYKNEQNELISLLRNVRRGCISLRAQHKANEDISESGFDNPMSHSYFQSKQSSFELKKDQPQFFSYKSKSQPNTHQEETSSACSVNYNGQLDQNAHAIQYDEALVNKSTKSKASLTQSSFLEITSEGIIEIQAYQKAIQPLTREIGIGTDEEERRRLLIHLIRYFNKKGHMTKWRSTHQPSQSTALNKNVIPEKKRTNAALINPQRNKQMVLNGSDYEIAYTLTMTEDKEVTVKGVNYKEQCYHNEEGNVKATAGYVYSLEKHLFGFWIEKTIKAKILQMLKDGQSLKKTAKHSSMIYSKSFSKLAKQRQTVLNALFHRRKLLRMEECLGLWNRLTRERMQYDNLSFELNSVLLAFYRKLAFERIKAVRSNPLLSSWKRWKAKIILPRLTIPKKRAKAINHLLGIRQLNQLHKHFVQYYTQTKAISLETVEAFIVNCQCITKKKPFQALITSLSVKSFLKRILLNETSSSLKNRINSKSPSLSEAFFQWKATALEKQQSQIEDSLDKAKKKRHNAHRYNRNKCGYSLHDLRRFNLPPKTEESIDNEASTPLSRHCSFDLIGTKRETLKPTIYSSQSFYLEKDSGHPKSKVNLQSNFYSMFDISASSLMNPRIQVTKATIPIDSNKEDANELSFSSEKVAKSTVMSSCRNDLNASTGDPHNQVHADVDFAFAIKEKPLQFKSIEHNEDIKTISLVNHKGIIPKTVHHKRYNTASLGEVTTIKSHLRENDGIIRHSFTKEANADGTFQLKEMNTSQFYHSPIKHSNTIEKPAGIYTNITKSNKRGKMPVFHSKKNSMNNTATSISFLSFAQPNEANKQSNLYDGIEDEGNALQEKQAGSYWDIQLSMNNRSLTNRIFPNDSYSYDTNPFMNSNLPGNIFDNTRTIQVDSVSPSFPDLFSPDYSSTMNSTSMPKFIKSKTIWFKHKDKQATTKEKDMQSKQISLTIDYKARNVLLSCEYYFKSQKLLLLLRLHSAAKGVSAHFNLIELMKVTLIHRGSRQLSLIKEIVNLWRLSIQRHKRLKKQNFSFKVFNSTNSLLLIQGSTDNHIAADDEKENELNSNNTSSLK